MAGNRGRAHTRQPVILIVGVRGTIHVIAGISRTKNTHGQACELIRFGFSKWYGVLRVRVCETMNE